MIYSFRTLNDCAMSSIVYLNGNEHDAYQIVGINGDDVILLNLTSNVKMILPGTAECERPKNTAKEPSDESPKIDAAATVTALPPENLQKQEEVLAEEIKFHRTRAIASRRLGDHHVEEHEAEIPDALYETLLEAGFDPADLDCTEVTLSGLPEPDQGAKSA